MKRLLLLTLSLILLTSFTAPTQRYLSRVPLHNILATMKDNGLSIVEAPLFEELIAKETRGFIGYHAGSSQYRLFQDLIRLVVEEVLEIPVRSDFHFLRVPGEPYYDRYSTASDFVATIDNTFHDREFHINQHIISLNIALFESHDNILELTPRYFVQNKPWTTPDYWNNLRPFVEDSGINWEAFELLIRQGMALLPHHRGVLIQFFDASENYDFLDTHCYTAHEGGLPHSKTAPSHYVADETVTRFPQLRLVINNKDVLNPHSPLIMHRYDVLTADQRNEYEKTMRAAVRALGVDSEAKREQMRAKLLSCWSFYQVCDRILIQP